MKGRVKVSIKNQIALPADARRKLGIKCGDSLLVEVVGGAIVLKPEPRDWAAYLEGLGREIWEGIDAQEYVNSERDLWEH